MINVFSQRHRSFLNIQRFEINKTSLNLIQDVSIRWNSIFLMMKRALVLKVDVTNWLSRESSNFSINRRTRSIFKSLIMIEKEWREVTYMIDLLKSFYQWTQEIEQSRDLTIHYAFTAYNSLFDHLKNQRKKCANADISWFKKLKATIHQAIKKLSHYYERTEDKKSTLYNLETILNLTQKTSTYKICFLTDFSHKSFETRT
jgi:hypothetical protein